MTVMFEDRERKALVTIVPAGFEGRDDRQGIQRGQPSILERMVRRAGRRRDGASTD